MFFLLKRVIPTKAAMRLLHYRPIHFAHHWLRKLSPALLLFVGVRDIREFVLMLSHHEHKTALFTLPGLMEGFHNFLVVVEGLV